METFFLIRKPIKIRFLVLTFSFLQIIYCSGQNEKINESSLLPWNKLQSLSGKEFKVLSPAKPQKVRFGISLLPGLNVYNSKSVISENKTDLINTLLNNKGLLQFLFDQMDGEFEIFPNEEDRRLITSNMVFKTEVWAQIAEKLTVNLYYYRGKFIHNSELLASSPESIGSFLKQEFISVSSGIKASGFGAGTTYLFTEKYLLSPFAGLDFGLQHLERYAQQASILNRDFNLIHPDLVINQLVTTLRTGMQRELGNRISFRFDIAYPIPLSNKNPINPNALSVYIALGLLLF